MGLVSRLLAIVAIVDIQALNRVLSLLASVSALLAPVSAILELLNSYSQFRVSQVWVRQFPCLFHYHHRKLWLTDSLDS